MGNSTTVTATLKILADVSSAQSSVSKLASAFSKIKFSDQLTSDLKNAFTNFDAQAEKLRQKLDQPIETKGDATKLNKAAKELEQSYNQVLNLAKQASKELGDNVDFSKLLQVPPEVKSEIKALDAEIVRLERDLEKLKGANVSKMFNIDRDALIKTVSKGRKDEFNDLFDAIDTGKIDEIRAKWEALSESFEKQRARWSNSQGWKNGSKILEDVGNQLKQVEASYSQTEAQLENAVQQRANATQQATQAAVNGFHEASKAASSLQAPIRGVAENTRNLSEAQLNYNREIDQMKSRISYFFGMNNAVRMLQRVLRNAFNAVKELDAAMTKTATVTDFSVGDMWDQLPRYTQAANELGTTTLGAYETMTLFYQQGLDTNEVFQIGTETMKMARIAGLDYEDATNKMTAALRGFNMELNETSAARVNDIYSELAA